MQRWGVQLEEAIALFDFILPGGARERLWRRKGVAVAAELVDVGVDVLVRRGNDRRGRRFSSRFVEEEAGAGRDDQTAACQREQPQRYFRGAGRYVVHQTPRTIL